MNLWSKDRNVNSKDSKEMLRKSKSVGRLCKGEEVGTMAGNKKRPELNPIY